MLLMRMVMPMATRTTMLWTKTMEASATSSAGTGAYATARRVCASASTGTVGLRAIARRARKKLLLARAHCIAVQIAFPFHPPNFRTTLPYSYIHTHTHTAPTTSRSVCAESGFTLMRQLQCVALPTSPHRCVTTTNVRSHTTSLPLLPSSSHPPPILLPSLQKRLQRSRVVPQDRRAGPSHVDEASFPHRPHGPRPTYRIA